MHYKIRLETEHIEPRPGTENNTKGRVVFEKALLSQLNGQEWEYKTIAGVESRLKYILGMQGSRIDPNKESNQLTVTDYKGSKVVTPVRLPLRMKKQDIEVKLQTIQTALQGLSEKNTRTNKVEGIRIPVQELYTERVDQMGRSQIVIEVHP